jgi:hypothetical protein
MSAGSRVWTPDDPAPRLERTLLVWHPVDAGRPFELDLELLFRPI